MWMLSLDTGYYSFIVHFLQFIIANLMPKVFRQLIKTDANLNNYQILYLIWSRLADSQQLAIQFQQDSLSQWCTYFHQIITNSCRQYLIYAQMLIRTTLIYKFKYIMKSLVQRWQGTLNSIQTHQEINNGNSQHQNKSPKKNSQHVLKKSRESQNHLKLSAHSQDKSRSKKLLTPSKKKSKHNKNTILQKTLEDITHLIQNNYSISFDKNTSNAIKTILQNVWNQTKQNVTTTILKQSAKIEMTEPEYSLHQSHITSNNSLATAKKHEKLYQDLERRYLDCEKQKHFLKNKVESWIVKYQNIDRQLERYAKMQKLIDKCMQRQQEIKNQNTRLRKSLQVADIKQVQQQKIFQKQIMSVYQLVDSIKQNLREV